MTLFQRREPESPYAWLRLGAALLLMTVGGSGIYAMSVALLPVQAEFGITRAEASLPYTLTMIGFGLGGVVMGRMSDRFGVMVPALVGAVALGAGYLAAGSARNLTQFSFALAVLIGFFGAGSTLAPLVADVALWFTRRRGIAVGIVMSGNYVAGTIWPPLLQHFFERAGWRITFIGVGVFSFVACSALAFMLKGRAPRPQESTGLGRRAGVQADPARPFGLPPRVGLALLCAAGVGCCVAMSMPQVHMVAYCGELGFAAARGAEMLAVMLGFGVASRLIFGWISDRIGGLRTLLLGALLQGVALMLFIPFQQLVALYLISALFGLFQGGLIPAYAIVVREHFSPRHAASHTGIVLMATLFGMALGGWLPGVIFDATGSYRAAFLNGMAWNAVTVCVALFLLLRVRRGAPLATRTA